METGERGFLRGAKLVDCNVPGFHQVTAQLGAKRRRREGDALIRELKHLLLLSVKPRAKVNDPRRKEFVLLALECKSQRFAEFALRPTALRSVRSGTRLRPICPSSLRRLSHRSGMEQPCMDELKFICRLLIIISRRCGGRYFRHVIVEKMAIVMSELSAWTSVDSESYHA